VKELRSPQRNNPGAAIGHALLLPVALVFAAHSHGASDSRVPSSRKHGEKPSKVAGQSAVEQRGTENAPLYVKSIPSPESEAEAAHRQYEYHEKPALDRRLTYSTIALAAFTLLLFIFTAALWWVTLQLSRQARAEGERHAAEMKESLGLAEASNRIAKDEFQYVHRPRLTIRRERVRFFPKDNGINFVLANIGHLPATEINGQFTVKIVPAADVESVTKESLPPYDGTVHNISEIKATRSPDRGRGLGASERAMLYFIFSEITQTAMESVKRKESILCFFGYLDFLGPDGVRRGSAFFRTYKPDTETFVASEDPDYEHH